MQYKRAAELFRSGELSMAGRICAEILISNPASVAANHLLGVIYFKQNRFAESLARINDVLEVQPRDVEALNHRGIALAQLQRFSEALASFELATTINPSHMEAQHNCGKVLKKLNRFEDALNRFDQVLASRPADAEALVNRGITLWDLKRFEEAVVSHEAALNVAPDFAEAFYNRANALRRLNRYEEARSNYEQAIFLKPNYDEAYYNLGAALCEQNLLDDGFAVFMRWARFKAQASNGDLVSPHQKQHLQEQKSYCAALASDIARGNEALRIERGTRLAGPALNPFTAAPIVAAQWNERKPRVVVIDDFLTSEALDALQRFCWGSAIWRNVYENYLGAFPEHGFACPLLAQIADELRLNHPTIFDSHPLLYLWGFKYGSGTGGAPVHADFAVVNVNFWITPDEANLDPTSGGLIVWDVGAPPDWDFAHYNSDHRSAREFLAKNGARPVNIPYRGNRAVIFDSSLFHETDRIRFKEGYCNRRINVTLLYGRRST
jgi:tetratricopeptide (TPR) repeat protein